MQKRKTAFYFCFGRTEWENRDFFTVMFQVCNVFKVLRVVRQAGEMKLMVFGQIFDLVKRPYFVTLVGWKRDSMGKVEYFQPISLFTNEAFCQT